MAEPKHRFTISLSPEAFNYLQQFGGERGKGRYIDNLLLNARTFDRFVAQWYFEDWTALDRDNTRIWNTYYRNKPLFDHLPTWQDWLPEYRQLIVEVQEMVAEHTAQGTWRRRPYRLGYPA